MKTNVAVEMGWTMGIDAEMFVRLRGKITPRRVKRIAFEMAGAFGHDKFWIDREHERRALTIVKQIDQDGPTIRPKDGETFVRCHLWGRYYGEGYERGDMPFLITLAEWLEMRFVAEDGVSLVDVWYGGDSSGVIAARFDAKARGKLFAHFVANGHRPYRSGWDMGGAHSRHCEFCDEPMRQYLWGGGDERAGFECDGCGLCEVTSDRGKTWATEKRA